MFSILLPTKRLKTILAITLIVTTPLAMRADNPAAPTGTLPVLYINTDDGAPIVSKTEYVNGTYWLDAMDIPGIEGIGSQSVPLDLQIKGRGHSSWKGVKKPYKIKLGKKQAILDMPGNKHWALLTVSSYTLAGFELDTLIGMDWTPALQPVELVLNGRYDGLYWLTETVRIDTERVDIWQQPDLNTDCTTVSGGWLVEVDNYHDDCQITVPECSKWALTLRYHSPERLSNEQLSWLTDEFNAINQAVYSEDKGSTDWEDYLDVESMAKFFIVQEVLDNPDGFHGSFYLHKDAGTESKWIAGPLWDLTSYHREKTDYTFRMPVHYTITPHWIGQLIQYPDFCKAVADEWEKLYPSQVEPLMNYIEDVMVPLAEAEKANSARWPTLPYAPTEVTIETTKNVLRANMEWFDKHLPTTSGMVANISAEIPVNSFDVYNMQGIKIKEADTLDDALRGLAPGYYIINRRVYRIW